MSIIEVLVNKIADKISEKLLLEKEKKAVIAYGLLGILQVTTLFLLVTLLGLLTGTLYESFIIFFSVGFLRKSTGGAHAETMWGCNTVSVLSILILALMSRYVLDLPLETAVYLLVITAVFAVAFFVFYQRVPVDTPNKPIVSEKKIKRLRKESFGKLLLLMLIAVICVFNAERLERLYSITSSILMAVVWQMITLTEQGAHFLRKMDTALSKLLQL